MTNSPKTIENKWKHYGMTYDGKLLSIHENGQHLVSFPLVTEVPKYPKLSWRIRTWRQLWYRWSNEGFVSFWGKMKSISQLTHWNVIPNKESLQTYFALQDRGVTYESLKEKSIQQRAAEWIASQDTGTSSETIWAFMMGVPQERITRVSVPSDPSDFGRCYRLFQLIPEWEKRIEELRELKLETHINEGLEDERHNDDLFGSFVDHYKEMKRLYEGESPSGTCPKLYALMQSLCF